MNKFFSVKSTYNIIIFIIFAVLSVYVLLQLTNCCSWNPLNIYCTYTALFFIPIVYAFLLWQKFDKKVKKRREVELDELNNLYSEIEQYSSSSNSEEITITRANDEKDRLEEMKTVFEIDALPLRQLLVDLYKPEHELIAKSRRELVILEDYKTAGEEAIINDFETRVKKIISDLERLINEKNDSEGEKNKHHEPEKTLRAEFKTLRETVAWYDKTWAYGEVMRNTVSYWMSLTVFVTLLIGILPIVHSHGNSNLIILHWASLGITGSLLSTILRLHDINVPELGKTQGKQLLQETIRNIVIGAVTSVLLYVAILGGVLDGAIFPELQISIVNKKSILSVEEQSANIISNTAVEFKSLKNVGLSIFWGIFAGMSPAVLRTLTRVADTSLGDSGNRRSNDGY